MIFVTVGTQLPFDRLVKAMDEIAPSFGGEPIICQTLHGQYKPVHMDCRDYLDREEYTKFFKDARVIVSHAGMGSILNALNFGKNIIIMPRDASLGEHRNNHQIHTAAALKDYENIYTAYNKDQLSSLLLNTDFTESKYQQTIGSVSQLSESINSFLLDCK